VWPLQQLIRALGAYFVRRDSGNPLYRRVLERYVQIAVEGGVTQAVFPEGGLSRDGLMRQPRIGLLDYMLRNFDPDGERDIVFVPVALNYDRVLEDRTLLAENDPDAEQRSGLATVKMMFKILGRGVKLRMRGQLYRFGYACANFGSPISMRAYAREQGWNPRREEKDERIPKVFELAGYLIDRVGKLVPVLPVSLLATVFLREPEIWMNEEELKVRSRALKENLKARGANIYVPREDPDYFVTVGLRMLTLRRLLDEDDGRYRVKDSERRLLTYYANAIEPLTRGLGSGNSL
jgi:glycerol-3-phosphate O-acyltransferase